MIQPNASPDWEGNPADSGLEPIGGKVEWWVMVQRMGKTRTKFYSGHRLKEDAEELALEQNVAEKLKARRANAANVEFVYTVVPRQEGT